MSLEDAIDQITRRHPRDSGRLTPLADYIKARLEAHGLPGVRGGTGGELVIPGLARRKQWDVAYDFAGKPRLLVSLKSIWANAGGTVPNRIDDLMGEAANVQQMSPEIVVGYVVLFDARADAIRGDGRSWSGYFEDAVKRIAIRKAPLWNQGLLEGSWFIRFDSGLPHGSRILEPDKVAAEGTVFFQSLIEELRIREPAVPFAFGLTEH